MTISFNNIPSNVRVPKAYFDIDPQNPTGGGTLNRMLLVGARNNGGAMNPIPDDAPDNRPIPISSGAAADTAFGVGSQLARMCRAALDVAPQLNMWAMAAPLTSPQARTIHFTLAQEAGTTTVGSGSVFITINGVEYTVNPVGAANFGAVGSQIVDILSDEASVPYTATYTGTDGNPANTLIFTAKATGEVANGDTITIDQRGVNVTFTPAATGTLGAGGFETSSSESDFVASAILTDEQFDMVVIPSALDDVSGAVSTSNTSVLNAFETQMERRWSSPSNAYGHVLTSFKGTVAEINTLMSGSGGVGGRNNQYETIVCYEANSTTPEYLVSAVYGARVFASLVADPARPATGLSLRGVNQPANPQNNFTEANRNAILNDGGATIRYVQGEAEIERATTTRRNTGNADDFNWFDIQTPFTVVVCARSINNFIANRYGRSKLSDTAPVLSSGVSNTITTDIIQTELLGLYRNLIENGLCDGYDAFAADPNFVVQRDPDDATVVEIAMPLRLVNQARVFKIKINFQL